MRTIFYNVGHGEAIKIKLEHKIIIRDFGQALSTKKYIGNPRHNLLDIDCLVSYLIKEISQNKSKTYDAIVSHAHEDHYNGFEKMYKMNPKYKFFENSYIPWLPFGLKTKGLNSYLLSLLIILSMSKHSKTRDYARRWLFLAPKMSALSKHIIPVKQGYSEPNWRIQNRFLWPSDKVLTTSSSLLEESFLVNHIDSVLTPISNQFREILSKYFDDEIQGESFSTEDIEHMEALLKDNEARINIIRREETVLFNLLKLELDNHSVVFEIGEEDEKSLFLSDAYNPTVSRIINLNKLNNYHYKFIKTGHHGTRGENALFKQNITAKCLVSCSGPANNRWSGPSLAYNKLLSPSSSKHYCLDWNYIAKWNKIGIYNFSIPKAMVFKI
ncbi:MAG: hypothetical protein ABFR02_08850 [Campylobacterota bacterium]